MGDGARGLVGDAGLQGAPAEPQATVALRPSSTPSMRVTLPTPALGSTRANREPAIDPTPYEPSAGSWSEARAIQDELPAGASIGEYEVVRRLGAGGMGAVYLCRQPLIERLVAIKVLGSSLVGSTDATARFIQEARASNRIRHRNIVDVFGVGSLPDGRLYLVMEYLEGQDLHRFCVQRGPLGFDEAEPIVAGILGALAAAHAAGVVHRDLKPENIFITPGADVPAPPGGREVRILDFGLAKLRTSDGADSIKTRTGVMLGTPAYMSPEQCRALVEVDARSDLYSLGVILYRLYTGYLPFDGPSYIDVINLHLGSLPMPPSELCGVPGSLDRLMLRLLEKRPADRFQSAVEVAAALAACDDARGWLPSGATRPPVMPSAPLAATAGLERVTVEATRRPAAAEVTTAPTTGSPSGSRRAAWAAMAVAGALAGALASTLGLAALGSRTAPRDALPASLAVPDRPPPAPAPVAAPLPSAPLAAVDPPAPSTTASPPPHPAAHAATRAAPRPAPHRAGAKRTFDPRRATPGGSSELEDPYKP